jgi:type IV pilus assembly protein PilF
MIKRPHVLARWLAALIILLPFSSVVAQEPQMLASDEAAIANLQLGISYMRQGNLALAREKIDKALRQAPKNADVHTAAAMLEERLGKTREAEMHHRTALRLAPTRPELSNNYAVYLCRIGKHADGVKRFVEVAANKLYATPQTAFTNAGVCARAGKQPDQAVGYFKRAMQIMPNHAEAVVQLADLELSRGRLKEAREEVDRYLTTFRANPDVLLSCVQVARAQADKLAEERCARRLRTDFAGSEAARRLPPTPVR